MNQDSLSMDFIRADGGVHSFYSEKRLAKKLRGQSQPVLRLLQSWEVEITWFAFTGNAGAHPFPIPEKEDFYQSPPVPGIRP